MYRLSRVVIGLVSLLMCAGAASAQTANAAKFSGPVQLPGVLLPAGSYTFTVAPDSRSVVVSDGDKHFVTTLQVAPITRAARGDIITMRSAVEGAAPEIVAVYSNGGTKGVQFLYRAVQK